MQKHSIGGIPITDQGGRLVGILTNRDLRFEKNHSLLVRDLMTKENLVTAPDDTLEQARDILQTRKIEKLPVVDKDYQLIGLITYKDIIKGTNFPQACKDLLGRLVVGAAVGVTSDVEERVAALVAVGVDVVCLDTAHGHSRGVLEACESDKTKISQSSGHRRQRGDRGRRQSAGGRRGGRREVGVGRGRFVPPALWRAWVWRSYQPFLMPLRPYVVRACRSSAMAASVILATLSRL